MTPLLSIETATSVCSVAIHNDGSLVAQTEFHLPKIHAAALTPAIDFLLKQSGINQQELAAIAVSKGPGSYTGLRIGVAAAKALSFTHGIPLIGIETMEAMALSVVAGAQKDHSRICTMLDARRMEVYYSLFDQSGKTLTPANAEIVTEEFVANLVKDGNVIFCGDGVAKSKSLLALFKNAYVIDFVYPSARWIGELATVRLKQQRFENLADFEPYYLKEFAKHSK